MKRGGEKGKVYSMETNTLNPFLFGRVALCVGKVYLLEDQDWRENGLRSPSHTLCRLRGVSVGDDGFVRAHVSFRGPMESGGLVDEHGFAHAVCCYCFPRSLGSLASVGDLGELLGYPLG